MKKIIYLMILCMVLGSVTGCISYVKVSDGDGVVEEVETTKKLGNSRVDRAELARDKSTVEELCYMASYTLSDADYIGVKTSGNAVASDENGQIDVSKLFDTSTEEGKDFVDRLTNSMDLEESKIKFKSDFKTECTLEIVECDAKTGKVVIQLVAEGYGMAFYVDADGEHEGIYGE